MLDEILKVEVLGIITPTITNDEEKEAHDYLLSFYKKLGELRDSFGRESVVFCAAMCKLKDDVMNIYGIDDMIYPFVNKDGIFCMIQLDKKSSPNVAYYADVIMQADNPEYIDHVLLSKPVEFHINIVKAIQYKLDYIITYCDTITESDYKDTAIKVLSDMIDEQVYEFTNTLKISEWRNS